jgi:tetratricopeptide (TPR) repeat protein
MGEAQKIAENFYSSHFADVSKALSGLQSSGPSVTMRVGQNNACSTFFLDGQENPTAVISGLRKILAECLSALGTAGVLNQSSGSLLDTPPEFLAESLIKTVDLGAASTILFNLASLYFVSRQYDESQQILEVLFEKMLATTSNDNASPLGSTQLCHPGKAIKICFLLLEIKLRVKKSHGFSNSAEMNEWEMQMKQVCAVVDWGAQKLDQKNSTQKNLNWLLIDLVSFRLLVYKCRIGVAMRNADFASTEIENALNLYKRKLEPYASQQKKLTGEFSLVDNAAVSDLIGFLGHLHKRSASSAPTAKGAAAEAEELSAQLNRHYQLAVVAKGQLEYMKGEHASYVEALNDKYWRAAGGDSSRVQYNNTACHLFREEKYALARNFFNMALVEEKKKQQQQATAQQGDKSKKGGGAAGGVMVAGSGKKPSRLYQCCLSHSYEADFTYNEGLSSLKSGRSLHAFTCFEKVIPSFEKSPKLWIRLAECCIQYNDQPDQATTLMQELEPGNPLPDESKPSLDKVDYASARLYLCKALHLIRSKIDYIKGSISSNDSKEKWDNDQQVHQLLLELEISVLVKLAFVSLGDNDPFNAVYHSFEALSSPIIDRIQLEQYRDLALSYCLEALCMTGQVGRARDIAERYQIQQNSFYNFVSSSTSGEDQKKEAKMALAVNNAVTLVFQGNLEGAQMVLEDLLHRSPNYRAAKWNVLYILVRKQKFDSAFSVLRLL